MMHASYVTDKNGRKVAVQIPIKIYEKLEMDSEELYEIKAYDRAKARKSEPIPFEQSVKEIDLLRNDHLLSLYRKSGI